MNTKTTKKCRKIKDRVCHAKECFILFTPWNSLTKACSPECALDLVRAKSAAKARADIKVKEKADRKQHKADKERIKSRGDWLKEAQAAFNKYIRLRDRKDPCISCQRYHQGQYHNGHYRSVGGNPELRFEEFNCAKQCSVCNNHLSGNLIDYRINLIKKISQDKVDWLEGPHEPKHYTIDDIKAIKKKYAKMARDLEKELEIL